MGCATEEEQWAQEQQVLASLGPIERALASLRVKREQLRREQEEDSNIDALGGADKPLLDADVGRNEEKMVPVDGRPEGKGGQVDGADKAAVGQGKTVGAEDKAFEGEWRGEEGELVEAASPWTAFPNEMDWWRETCPLRLVRPEGHEDHASSLQEHHGDARGNRGQEAADKAARLHDDALREDNGEALDSLHESSTQKALWIHSRAADLGNPSALSTIGHMHAGG